MMLTNLLKGLDGYRIIRKGEDFILKKMENKQEPPRSWEEFCKRYPVQDGECFITPRSNISSKEDYRCDFNRYCIEGRNWCTSMEEAQAFLALMQLRQLRKAWVGDWKPSFYKEYAIIILYEADELKVEYGLWAFTYAMSFPTEEMAEDFLGCFRDLCEKAKILL